MKKRLFVDMDGTLAVFHPVDKIETLYQKGYFLNLEPIGNVLVAIRQINKQNPNIVVNILSAYLTDSRYAYQEKMMWLNRYLPEVPLERRILVPFGQDKEKQIVGGLQAGDYLFDDYTKNLAAWNPKQGIKLLNGINHTRGTWQGNAVRFDKPPDVLTPSLQRRSWLMPKELKLNLPPADDLFSTQEQRDENKRERVINLPLSEISDFPYHPFKVRMDTDMLEMIESVKQYGVLVPGLVRPKGDCYEMVAGHRRKAASQHAECDTMPVIVRDFTDDEAVIVMVDSNLQRDKILPSEKAHAYKMKMEALSRQGKRTDLTCAPLEHKSAGQKSRDIVAQESGDSREQVRRYVRLHPLCEAA